MEIPKGWTEVEAMNELQEHGIISDNCVDWKDVGNQEEAIKWLNNFRKKSKRSSRSAGKR